MKKLIHGKIGIFIIVAIVIILNFLATFVPFRLDLTNEKRFTLSHATNKVIRKVDDIVVVDVFLKGDFNSAFTKLARRTEDVLKLFKEEAGSKLQYNFLDATEKVPGTDVSWGDSLTNVGMVPINLKSQLKQGEQQQLIFPVALVRYKNNIIPVDLFTGNKTFISPSELNSAEAQMEYKFANAIDKISQTSKPLVAYATGHGEPEDVRTYDLAENVLQTDYNLNMFNIAKLPAIPDTFSAVIIVKPTQPFNDYDQLKIDQYIMRGGKVLFFVDRLNAELDSLRLKDDGNLIAYDRGLGLNNLFFKYGARINADLVMDLQCDYLPFDVNSNGQFEFLHWNYFPLFETKSNHPINKNLGLVAGKFSNSIDTIEVVGIKHTPLLSSSPNARTIATPALITGRENVNAPQSEKFKQNAITTAMLLEGKFTSLFQYQISQAFKDSLTTYGYPFVPKMEKDGKLIIVADGDLPLNSVTKEGPLPMGLNPYTAGSQYEFQFANKEFVQNCLDYLINNSGLSEVKAKDYQLRLLDSKKLETERGMWQVVNIVLPIIIILLAALLFRWLHKRKYTK